jgi:hypothetical protein
MRKEVITKGIDAGGEYERGVGRLAESSIPSLGFSSLKEERGEYG